MTVKDDLHHPVDEDAARYQNATELSAIDTEIRCQLPHLSIEDGHELARVVGHLVRAFRPERIYVFGSHARGTPTANSDVDLLVLVASSDQLPHQRAQKAYTAVGAHHIPLDILVMTRQDFDTRLPAVASLPATVAREGRTVYATTA
ncbi:MAG: nucleotidyltransferase domain-containing protein [Chloroflexota bacterium]|nr:nucleotidyltransferase domain-containing protein [Chloroflexota bacterium]